MTGGPRLIVRTVAGRVLLDVPLVPGTTNEVVVPDAARLDTTSLEYRRRPT